MSISNGVIEVYQNIEDDKNHRYRSWEHCYQFFQSKPKDIDTACLHLGFYLASWGMYRGSSFLLQKDYKIHHGAVQEILKSDYDVLRGVSLENFSDENIHKLFIIKDEISAYYKKIKLSMPEFANDRETTDTLVTKVLLGTLGCVPAYDRFFIDGIRATKKITYSSLNKSNFKKLLNWCVGHAEELDSVRKGLKSDIHYPIMKIVDMYFWREGEKIEIEKKKEKQK